MLPQFKIPLELLKSQNLNVSVWHHDTFRRNSFLGEVDVDLSGWDFGNTRINDYVLQSRVSVADLSDAAGACALHTLVSVGHFRPSRRRPRRLAHSPWTTEDK